MKCMDKGDNSTKERIFLLEFYVGVCLLMTYQFLWDWYLWIESMYIPASNRSPPKNWFKYAFWNRSSAFVDRSITAICNIFIGEINEDNRIFTEIHRRELARFQPYDVHMARRKQRSASAASASSVLSPYFPHRLPLVAGDEWKSCQLLEHRLQEKKTALLFGQPHRHSLQRRRTKNA